MLKISHIPESGQPPLPRLPAVDPARLRHWVERFAYPRHFLAEPEANRRTGLDLCEILTGFGYEAKREGKYGNVVAMPARRTTRPMLIATHYDSVPDCPAADDNGSGMAVVLHLAEVMRGAERGVHFALFNREEDGLLGSLDFVREWSEHGGPNYAEVHVLEMVGYRDRTPGSQRPPPGLPVRVPDTGDFIGLLGNRDSNAVVRDLVRLAGEIGLEVPVTGLQVLFGLEQKAPVLLRSDHAPFWHARVPAVMWTDTAEYRNPNYHQASDLPDTLDYDFMAAVCHLLLARIAEVREV